MELYSVLCGSLDGRGIRERINTCICMAEPVCCSPETITTLLISYTPIPNKKFKKLKKKTQWPKKKSALQCRELGFDPWLQN